MSNMFFSLNDQDRATVRTAIAFLDGKLSSRDTLEWALNLSPNELIKRTAINELLTNREGSKLKEPWISAWRLIEESWKNPIRTNISSTDVYQIQERLKSGDRSSSIINSIVGLVAPEIKVEKRTRETSTPSNSKRTRPRLDNLLYASLSSPALVDISILRIDEISDTEFLTRLINALDATVQKGMDIAKQIGWDGEKRLWRLGILHRVEYMPKANEGEKRDEDEFHEGIGPSVKLLHATLQQLSTIDTSTASRFLQQWTIANDPIHIRLWASLSRNCNIAPIANIEEAFLSLSETRFWDLHNFPEIAELRAVRFSEFSKDAQSSIIRRIKKGPPASQWGNNAPSQEVKSARRYWTVRELRRIELAKGVLPVAAQSWLNENLDQFPDLKQMNSLDEGFLSSPTAYWVKPNPDDKFDLLTGDVRLHALENALSSPRGGWADDPAERAGDWIRTEQNTSKLVQDFQSTAESIGNFPLVLSRFSWAHGSESIRNAKEETEDLKREGNQIITLLLNLTDNSAHQAIEGLSHWLSTWRKLVVASPELISIWRKFWPIAVKETNSVVESSEEIELNLVAQSDSGREPMDLDTLNTAAGRLVSVFLEACPNLEKTKGNPFEINEPLNEIRESLVMAPGRAGLIAKHRLIESLSYFLKADENWTRKHLLATLGNNDSSAVALWRAIARRIQSKAVLNIIGDQVVGRVTDQRLGRETRKSLLSSLVVEALHSFLDIRDAAVSYSSIQQAIRSVEDEVRASAAQIVQRFLVEMVKNRESEESTLKVEIIFRDAVLPFLQKVWPQERSLTTPGVSSAFAHLPAAAGTAFPEAVDAIEGFLVPFSCWSLLDFGFRDRPDGSPQLHLGRDRKKASAALRLFDATIGSIEGAVVPMELSDALEQIRQAAPELAALPAFRRLATLARRR
jgi:hypothetical protein